MILAFLTFLTAFLMEGIGSYMSVVGWNSLLAGDWVVIALFVVLDLAKIVSVSFLYQTWREIKKTWRAYLVFAVVFLMVLTSAGSFGYLSSSFQQAMAPNKEVTLQLQSATSERDRLLLEKKQLTESKTKIEDQIAKLPDNSVSGRSRLIANFREETRGINSKVAKIDSRLEQLNATVLEQSKSQLQKDVHVGPIVYFANAFDMSVEKVVSIAILSIIFVFDPLAVSLILAGNFLVARRKNKPSVVAPILQDESVDPPVNQKALKTFRKKASPKKKEEEIRKEIENEILEDVKAVLDEELPKAPEAEKKT